MPEFVGNYLNTVDTKNRVAVPAPFREILDSAGEGSDVYLTYGLDGCLELYPPEEWERRKAQLLSLPGGDYGSRDVRMLRRRLFGTCVKRPLDKQGRILLPDTLKSKVGIDREVVFAGNGNVIELWSREAWDRMEDAFTDDRFLARVDDIFLGQS